MYFSFKIIILDLILQKPKAYRHLFYNVLSSESSYFQVLFFFQFNFISFAAFYVLSDTVELCLQDLLRKLSFGFLLLDGCIHLILEFL